MKFSCRLVLTLWGGLFAALPVISVAQPQVLVHIETNDANAAVYADSVYLGLANGSPYWVDHDTDVIRLSTLRAAAWSVSPLRKQLIATPGDTVLVTLNFPMYHRIESHPFGAEAWLQEGSERRLLGRTPVVFASPGIQEGMFHIEMEGYAPSAVAPRHDLWNRYEVSLVALGEMGDAAGITPSVRRGRVWIDWSAAALAMIAGAVAVHYKFRADRINDDYLATGDPSLRPRVARLDDRSGIALGVMQVGLVTLAVRFAFK